MIRRNIMGLLICIATLGVATLGFAGIPDLALSTASSAAAVQVSVFNLPDGLGASLDAARENGNPNLVDATVTLTLLDGNSDPIYLFPYEDIVMATDADGFVACTGGATADGSTDANGVTTFSSTFSAGGYSAAGEMAVVEIDGASLIGSDLNILFNSPDIDANGVVDISDTVAFVPAYLGAYDYMVDFYFDGVLDISDLVLYAGGVGASCP